MKKNKKAQVQQAEVSYLSARIIEQLGHDKVMSWLMSNVEKELSDLEKIIETAMYDYENSGITNKKEITLLKKIKKEQLKLIKLLTQFNEQRAKIEKMHQE